MLKGLDLRSSLKIWMMKKRMRCWPMISAIFLHIILSLWQRGTQNVLFFLFIPDFVAVS